MIAAMFARLPFLDGAGCARARAGVDALRRGWIPRHPHLPSFTLGAAAYLDAHGGLGTYLVRAARGRRLMEPVFGELHAALAGALAAHLGAPVELTPDLGLPGFHLFLAHPRLAELEPSLHFDLQHLDLGWDAAAASRPGERLSFTVAIELPRRGAGLDLWDVTLDDCPARDAASLAEAAARRPARRELYAPGELVLHDGDHLHRIAADLPLEPGERRLTLQGHGVRVGGRWVLYW
jgi:hypothetical protein